MASIEEDNNFLDEIAILESMFGDTVSSSVIATVIESCGGNVNLAADTIMSFSEITPTSEEPTGEKSDVVTLAQVPAEEPTAEQQPPVTDSPTFQEVEVPTTSYSEAFRSNGAVPKIRMDSTAATVAKPHYEITVWPDSVKKVLMYHNQGTRILILMRGAAGSGKTYLARHIVEYAVGATSHNYARHIYSTDNFFMRGGVYQFNRNRLEEAHMTNQKKVCDAANRGVSPIIVDNTNSEMWEMEPYTRDGVRNGYIIEIVEPDTSWVRNVHQLARRNIHGVPREAIQRMLDRYNYNITAEHLLKCFRLRYPANKTPPVKRNIPLFLPMEPGQELKEKENLNIHESVNKHSSFSPSSPNVKIFHHKSPDSPDEQLHTVFNDTVCRSDNDKAMSSKDASLLNTDEDLKIQKIIEAQQKFEQFEEAEKQWDNGESWVPVVNDIGTGSQDLAIAFDPRPPRSGNTVVNDIATESQDLAIALDPRPHRSVNAAVNDITTGCQDLAIALDPRPPRAGNTAVTDIAAGSQDIAIDPRPTGVVERNNTNKLFEVCDDWTKIAMFMPPWENELAVTVETPNQVETKSVGTCFELGDFNENTKVLYGESRNINEAMPDAIDQIKRSKIPQVIMLDKSTSTNENDLNRPCKYNDRHFKKLQLIFFNIPSYILRDIFESCNCNASWTHSVLTDCVPENQQRHISGEDIPDSDDDEPMDCDCLAEYNITSNVVYSVPTPEVLPAPEPNSQNTASLSQKKPKKEIKISASSLKLKRQIESNVMISDNHYSQHYLNTRRHRDVHYKYPARFNKTTSSDVNTEDAAGGTAVDLDNPTGSSRAESLNYVNSNGIIDIAVPSTSHYNFQLMESIDSDTESESNKSDDLEKTVAVDLGPEFLKKIDDLFGRENFQYPEYIRPVVNLPISILSQINAHWAMSIASQMDEGSNQSEQMIKQDEEFARQLATREQELTEEGKEPDVPTLKEIMDMELAYSIYEKNVAEWRNNEPQDLAARLSREKLYNLFPELTKEVLSELLMAHDYSFKDTVESLLISTGQAQCLENEKGIEKFVMQKEMERKEKFLEEENKNLSEEQWPYLTDPEKPVNLETVNHYRAEAQKHLLFRNTNFEKARQYFSNNSPYAASFYSEIAALHTRRYEQSSCLAAAYLMKYHLKNNPDKDVLDLHYLRVAEAMVNLDIFIDQIILKLRSNNIQYKETWIITGRGQHSIGGPRIKPATKRRLLERDILSKQVNGGLLMVTIHPTHKMTSELSENT